MKDMMDERVISRGLSTLKDKRICNELKKSSVTRIKEIKSMLGEEKGEKLYTVNRNVICIKCGNVGAVTFEGSWYSEIKRMSYAVGFGGTIPSECLNCDNRGLIDMDGLEGYKLAFTVVDKDGGTKE